MNYLIISLIVIVIFFYFLNKDSFSKGTEPLIQNVQNVQDVKKEVYLNDTRYNYPLTPPVNPNVYKTEVINSIPVNTDLYTSQEYSTTDYILDQPTISNTNQLNYSGGSTQLIKIPLQMNEPFDEQLRSQEILITPYNKIKYGNC